MATFNITEQEKQIVYKSLLFQRQELKRQLEDIDSLINKYKNESSVHGVTQTPIITSIRKQREPSEDSVSDKVLEVLNESETPLTSRGILNAIKKKYIEVNELSKDEDRKYMARVSATLSNRIKSNMIDKIKDDGKDPVYFIKKGQQLVVL